MTKIVIITGVSRGLGLATATEFANNGWKVIGTGRSQRPDSLPQSVDYHQFDASDPEKCEALFKQVAQENPSATFCLVNNAGAYTSGGLLQTEAQEYIKQMQSIYFSSVFMTRALVANVPKAKVINVVSNSALAAHKGNSAYGSAKAAQMHFFQSLQKELKPTTYQITNLYPSDIASHEPNPKVIQPEDLANQIRQYAELDTSYYVRDATIYPSAS